ncbi:MAG: hypothetical protein O7E57_16075 [Gammaproteobacteria bacterium]|nr:hypothetical protein [Gammaproteobacteria bacterium]
MRCKRLFAALSLSGWCVLAVAAPVPCGEPVYQDFDFWLGKWEVHVANGQPAGANHIARAQKGCLLVENWLGVQGSTGTSLNFYDPVAAQWRQLWVSPGVIIDIRGGLNDGSMVLEGLITYTSTSERYPFKGIWTRLDGGRVRQFFEESRTPGQWKPWFEGFYTRVEEGISGLAGKDK